ncbi:MAG: hypothetical protein WDO19_25045 [Bacteroidota bacterium]
MLFRKIEDTEIIAQVEKLKAGILKTIDKDQLGVNAQPGTEKEKTENLKPEIVYDDFAKIDLKVGQSFPRKKWQKRISY